MAPPSQRTRRRNPTIAAGAVIERSLVKRWISRELNETKQPHTGGSGFWDGYKACLFQLKSWLKAQPKRTATPGGIGR